MPVVDCASLTGQPINTILQCDDGLQEVERTYKGRISAAHDFIRNSCMTEALWPSDIPRPSSDRNAIVGIKYKAAFDLVVSAVAFVLFHEFYHVILGKDGSRTSERAEEELVCDVWAREFLTAKAAAYAESKQLIYADVLKRRSMSFVLAALIIHELTPIWEHGGNSEYFSVATRMKSLLLNTLLPTDSDFWSFSAAVLIGMCRQKDIPFSPPSMNSKALTEYLLELL